jgi:rhomboid protease GluP
VLSSDGLSPSVRRGPAGFELCVPGDEAERGAYVLSIYENENLGRAAKRRIGTSDKWDITTGVAICSALLLFFLHTGPRDFDVAWFQRGGADAERILLGELWRTVTALTLHADFGHVLSNALCGALFIGAVCGSLGAGVGSALILLAGAGGNLANAIFQGSHHVSVGASTAVFGAVGLLCGLGVARRQQQQSPGRPFWVPVAGGLAILAMLGTSGENVDIWAHLFGLCVGGALGVPVGFALRRPPGSAAQWLVGTAAFVAVFYCWGLAFI